MDKPYVEVKVRMPKAVYDASLRIGINIPVAIMDALRFPKARAEVLEFEERIVDTDVDTAAVEQFVARLNKILADPQEVRRLVDFADSYVSYRIFRGDLG